MCSSAKYIPQLGLVLFVLLLGCGSDEDRRIRRLVTEIESIERWLEADTYSADGWAHLRNCAQLANTMPTNEVVSALERIGSSPNFSHSCGAFILLRMMFDLPQNADPTNRLSTSVYWLTENRDFNGDGTLNVGWPIVWSNGVARFSHSFEGYSGVSFDGPTFDVVQEYNFIRSNYEKREFLSK